MPVYRGHARVAGILIIPLLLVVAACDVITTEPGAEATHSVTQTATAIPQIASCATTLPEMQGAQVVEIPDTDFPNSGAAIVAVTSPTSAPMQIVQYTACMQVFAKGSVGHVSVPVVSNTSSPTAEVIDALHLVSRGWVDTPTFPFDGANFQPCTTEQLCYAVGSLHYLELEQITDHTQGMLTFVLRMASPQPLVACDPALFPVAFYPTSTAVLANAEFPLPPVTKVSGGYGDAEGITTYFCTGGTAASIQTYMTKHLPVSGWSSLTVNGVRLWKFPSGIGPVYMRILPITDPHKWAILTYYSGANFG
jgi:CheY-like chemotaxis protein